MIFYYLLLISELVKSENVKRITRAKVDDCPNDIAELILKRSSRIDNERFVGILSTWTLKTGYLSRYLVGVRRGCGGHVTVTVTGPYKTRRVGRRSSVKDLKAARDHHLRLCHNSNVSFLHRRFSLVPSVSFVLP